MAEMGNREHDSDARRSRRDLLKKAGVGGAIVWASPVVGAIAAPPAYAASSGCTVTNFSSTVVQETTSTLGDIRRLRLTFALDGCPAVASYRIEMTSPSGALNWNRTVDSPASSTTRNIALGLLCSEFSGETSVSFVFHLLDGSGNILCTFTGTESAPACV